MEKIERRGGKRTGSGRKKIGEKEVKIRLSEEQHQKLKRLGGSKWVIKKINEEVEHHV